MEERTNQQRNAVNKRTGGITGKTINFQDGLGAVTRRMIRERAGEIALFRGRNRVTREDRLQARKELFELRGIRDDHDPLEDGLDSLDPSEIRTGTGHQSPDYPADDDEELVQRRYFERGVREAGHDQMVAGYRSSRDDELSGEREERQEEAEEDSAEDEKRRKKEG